MEIGIVGGTGAEGSGLALRLARSGHHVLIGSRDAARGAAAARDAVARLDAGARVEGGANEDAVAAAEVVFVTVPFGGQAESYRTIRSSLPGGAIVVDATSPLATAVGGRPWHVVRPWHGSAAEQAAAILGPGCRLVAGLHTVSAEALADLDRPMDSDVFVCGDDPEAKAVVGGLLEGIPNLGWVDAGALSSARIAETLTALVISVNRTYKVRETGFRLTGRDGWGDPPA